MSKLKNMDEMHIEQKNKGSEEKSKDIENAKQNNTLFCVVFKLQKVITTCHLQHDKYISRGVLNIYDLAKKQAVLYQTICFITS